MAAAASVRGGIQETCMSFKSDKHCKAIGDAGARTVVLADGTV